MSGWSCLLRPTCVVGPKGKHDRDRSAKRHGHEQTSVCLGARRVPVSRPRVRTADDSEEVTLETFSHFADRDPLADVVLESPAICFERTCCSHSCVRSSARSSPQRTARA